MATIRDKLGHRSDQLRWLDLLLRVCILLGAKLVRLLFGSWVSVRSTYKFNLELAMNIVALIIQLISGAAGGNLVGALLKKLDLGTLGNSIAGILGGGLGGQ